MRDKDSIDWVTPSLAFWTEYGKVLQELREKRPVADFTAVSGLTADQITELEKPTAESIKRMGTNEIGAYLQALGYRGTFDIEEGALVLRLESLPGRVHSAETIEFKIP